MLDFDIRQCGTATGAPVDQSVVAVYEALLVEADKYFIDRAREPFIKREPLAGPVTGCAKPLQLIDDPPSVFGLPCPDALNEPVPAEHMAVNALCRELPLHHILRR